MPLGDRCQTSYTPVIRAEAPPCRSARELEMAWRIQDSANNRTSRPPIEVTPFNPVFPFPVVWVRKKEEPRRPETKAGDRAAEN